MGTTSLNILTLPLWWYTAGFKIALEHAKRSVRFTLKKSGLRIFASHIGDTLYGYTGRSDKIISFFIRIILLAAKTIILLFKLLFITAILFAYLLLLPIVLALIIYTILP